jgi:hypothetical protein
MTFGQGIELRTTASEGNVRLLDGGLYYCVEQWQEVFMIRYGMMLAAAVLMSASPGSTHARMAMQTFPVLAGAGRATSIRRQTGQSGSLHNPRANSAGSIRGPASRI